MTEYSDSARPQRVNKRIQTAKRNLDEAVDRWKYSKGITTNPSIHHRDEIMYSYYRAASLLEDAEMSTNANEMFDNLEGAVTELEQIQKSAKSTHSDYYAEWRNAVDSLVPAVEALESVVGDEKEQNTEDDPTKTDSILATRLKTLLRR